MIKFTGNDPHSEWFREQLSCWMGRAVRTNSYRLKNFVKEKPEIFLTWILEVTRDLIRIMHLKVKPDMNLNDNKKFSLKILY